MLGSVPELTGTLHLPFIAPIKIFNGPLPWPANLVVHTGKIREGFWLHPGGVPRGFISGLRAHCDLGLRCLNRQIPHTD